MIPSTTTSPGRMPDFLIIGAAKSGTSTLYDYLSLHPAVFMSRIKEPEFFALDGVFARGIDWYQSLFAEARPDQLCGEASTAYTRWPQLPTAAPRIAEFLPGARLIYLLRHPVDRAYSHYVHRATKELFPRQPIRWTFEEHVKHDPMCLDGSRYMDQIEQYLSYYSKDSFLCLFTDELQKSPLAVLSKVWSFLNLKPIHPNSTDLVSNETAEQRAWKIRSYTTAPLRRVPVIRHVGKLVPQTWRDNVYGMLSRSPYGRWVARRHTPKPMLPETRARLLKEFAEPNRRLAEFLGADLSRWNQ